MKITRITTLVGALGCLFLCLPSLHAQVPQIVNYQGRVAVSGTNFTGTGQFEFALVSGTGSGATSYWSNDGTSVGGSQPTNAVSLSVSSGLYSLALGDTTLTNMTPVPYSVFANSTVYLRVWFNDGTHGWQHLSPDLRIAAVGYAMNSATAAYASTSGTAASFSGTILGSQVTGTVPYAAAASSAGVAANALQLGGTNASSFAQTTGTYAGMTVGASMVATSSLFGSTMQDTAHLAGMNNDWHTTFSVSGAGTLVASGTGFYVVSGSDVPLASGTTAFSLSGSNSVVSGANLSGTSFIVRSTEGVVMSGSAISESGSNVIVMAGIGGPTLQCSANGTLWCDGTDDYSTFQAVLNSATTAQALTVYIDSDFAVSNTPRILSNTTVIGSGGHGWHVKPNVNVPGIGMNLAGATICNSNILIQNLPVDCNGPEQNYPRHEGSGFLQGSTTPYWVVGSWFGSCTNVETDNLTIINACTFSRVWSWASNCVSNGYRNFWSDEEPPSQFFYQDNNLDGDHLWGPCTHMRFNNGTYMGDDDQMVQCPVENTPEGGGVGITGANIVGPAPWQWWSMHGHYLERKRDAELP